MPEIQSESQSESGSGSPAFAVAQRILRVISTGEKLLCVTAFAVLVAVLFADVISREATSAGLHWASRIGVWANVLVVMAGFGLASSAGGHLRPRFLDRLLPSDWTPLLNRIQHALMALFCVAIGSVALAVVLESWQLGEVELTLFLPVWPVQALLPAAFFIAALRHLLFSVYPVLAPAESGAFDQDSAASSKGPVS